MPPDPTAAAIILAGGSGTRFGGPLNKVYRLLDDEPVLRWSLRAFAEVVSTIVVVSRPVDAELVSSACEGFTFLAAAGGATRTQSERSGLEALRDQVESGSIDVIAIHDGARPFITPDHIRDLISAARETGGAVPGTVTAPGVTPSDGSAAYELPGHGTVTVQTPQVFQANLLFAAYDFAPEAEAPDTTQIVADYLPTAITLIPSDPQNRKITFPGDL